MRPFSIIVSNHKKIAGNKSIVNRSLPDFICLCIAEGFFVRRHYNRERVTEKAQSNQTPLRRDLPPIAFLLLLRPLLASCVCNNRNKILREV